MMEQIYSFWTEPIVACSMLFCFIVFAIEFSGEEPFWHQFDENLANVPSKSFGFYSIPILLAVALLLGLSINAMLPCLEDFLARDLKDLKLLQILLLTVAFSFVKLCLYKVVNFSFFKKEKRSEWDSVYINVYRIIGYYLFVQFVVFTYLNVSAMISTVSTALCFILAKIVLLFYALRIFPNKIYGILHLIVYFCTLEIVPPVFCGAVWFR